MNKKIKWSISLILIIILLSGFAIFTNGNTQSLNIFDNIKKTKDDLELSKQKDDIIIEIGNEKITKEDLELSKVMSPNKSEQDIKEKLIENKVLKIVAENKKISVSEEEVLAYIDFVKEAFENSNKQSKALFEKYLDAYGFNESTFWTDPQTYEMYKDYLTQNKLREVILNEKVQGDKNIEELTNQEKREIIQSEIDHLVQSVKNKLTIKEY